MKNLFLILLCSFLTLISHSQARTTFKPALPDFEKNKPEGFTSDLWFFPNLIDHFSEFISFTEFTVWSHRKEVLSLAISGDSVFIVTQTGFPLDTPKVFTTRTYLNHQDFKRIIDSLRSIGTFLLKDEVEVKPCIRIIKKTFEGKELEGRTATSDITDGLQTLFCFYSKGKYRFVSYYELETAREWCPQLDEWKRAITTRKVMKALFEKYRRQGTWHRQGMKW